MPFRMLGLRRHQGHPSAEKNNQTATATGSMLRLTREHTREQHIAENQKTPQEGTVTLAQHGEADTCTHSSAKY